MQTTETAIETPAYAERLRERVRARRDRAPSVTDFWCGQSLSERFAATVGARPEATMLVEDARSFCFREIDQESQRLAAGMALEGVVPGSAIAYQLPNWHEAVVIFLAATRLGAHLVPLVSTLGAPELRAIFRETSPRLHFVNGENAPWVEEHRRWLQKEHPSTAAVPVRGSWSGERSYEKLLSGEATAPEPVVDPQAPAAIIYTSGSTAAPKGALHIHETLTAEIDSLRQAHDLTPNDRVLMPSPLGHISGVIHGILTPALLGTSAVLQPRWDPKVALDAIADHGVTYMIGAPVFLQEILAQTDLAEHDLHTLRLFSCGGAPVAPPLLADAREKLPHLTAKRVYGSSEFPTISTTDATDATARGHDSEGKPLRGIALRITDSSGHELPPGVEGEVCAQGPECFLGYVDPRLDKEAFDQAGYFRTGDLGIVDADGYLRISGRLKEIIVRKGENISAREIEEQILASCREFREVAVVALPDPIRGEIACACGRSAAGTAPMTLAAVAERLKNDGFNTRKLPERLEFFDDFPRLASGKVDKRRLAEILQDSGPTPLAGKRLRG
jgi:cyclohexanecarboxylate-CoA ligase